MTQTYRQPGSYLIMDNVVFNQKIETKAVFKLLNTGIERLDHRGGILICKIYLIWDCVNFIATEIKNVTVNKALSVVRYCLKQYIQITNSQLPEPETYNRTMSVNL